MVKKAVVTKFKSASRRTNLVGAAERRMIFTCCDGASYASTPYIGV
jgi:hypothetical protein